MPAVSRRTRWCLREQCGPLRGATTILDNIGAADQGIVEAPALVKSGSNFILFFSNGCFTKSTYTVNYATATSITGPYTRAASPLFATGQNGLTSPGDRYRVAKVKQVSWNELVSSGSYFKPAHLQHSTVQYHDFDEHARTHASMQFKRTTISYYVIQILISTFKVLRSLFHRPILLRFLHRLALQAFRGLQAAKDKTAHCQHAGPADRVRSVPTRPPVERAEDQGTERAADLSKAAVVAKLLPALLAAGFEAGEAVQTRHYRAARYRCAEHAELHDLDRLHLARDPALQDAGYQADVVGHEGEGELHPAEEEDEAEVGQVEHGEGVCAFVCWGCLLWLLGIPRSRGTLGRERVGCYGSHLRQRSSQCWSEREGNAKACPDHGHRLASVLVTADVRRDSQNVRKSQGCPPSVSIGQDDVVAVIDRLAKAVLVCVAVEFEEFGEQGKVYLLSITSSYQTYQV
ncbi:MFS general substrate transporter [Hortaea werneckii]|nr:MFS general substrate transporter [Hortaea werneckii]